MLAMVVARYSSKFPNLALGIAVTIVVDTDQQGGRPRAGAPCTARPGRPVAAGVPRERADHALALVQLALDMRDAAPSRTFGGETLAFRIGLNSGPVVAGVIGRKKFIYDLWGATVNLASRMESHGQSGTIQITRSTYDLVSAAFDCESAGT